MSVGYVADQVFQKVTVTVTETSCCGVCGGDWYSSGTVTADGNHVMSVVFVADQVIPEGDCDCNGNQLDECGVCGGDTRR